MKKTVLCVMCIGFLGILGCEKDEITITTGIVGIVEYGQGDCMPNPGGSIRIYSRYNGSIYFINKHDYENLGTVDFENIKDNSIKTTTIRNGELVVELPVDTFLIMPEGMCLYSDYNTIIIEKDILLEKNFKFWKCTSY